VRLEHGMLGVFTGHVPRKVTCKLPKYKLDFVGVQEVKWDKGGSEPADDYTFCYGNGSANQQLRGKVC
jgi:hypothetical protein